MNQVHTVGTMRTKRGEEKEVHVVGSKDHKLMRGELVARDNGKVMTICWMDKKPRKVGRRRALTNAEKSKIIQGLSKKQSTLKTIGKDHRTVKNCQST